MKLHGFVENLRCLITGSNWNLHPNNYLDSKVAVSGYLVICLNIFFFTGINITDRWLYDVLVREDDWVENLTVIWFFLTSLLLFATARPESNSFRRCIYILGAVAFLFAAGEEISWGQRLFGWTTPDFLMGLNKQNEINLHNISTTTFARFHWTGTMLLCVVTAVAFFYRQDRFLGIPLPSIPLLFGFLFMRFYALSISMEASPRQGLLILGSMVLVSMRMKWFVVVIASILTLGLSLFYIHGAPGHSPYTNPYEVYEYLLGIACLCYALELLLDQRRRAEVPLAAGHRVEEPPGGRIPFWMAACTLVMVGSTGLAVWQYVHSRDEAAALEKDYKWIVSGGSVPLAHSYFDFHIIGDRLVYFREPCAPADADRMLFVSVRIFPLDINDLPHTRQMFGFDELYHNFERHVKRSGDRCLLYVPLPDYRIAHIQIKQTIRNKDGVRREIEKVSIIHPTTK